MTLMTISAATLPFLPTPPSNPILPFLMKRHSHFSAAAIFVARDEYIQTRYQRTIMQAPLRVSPDNQIMDAAPTTSDPSSLTVGVYDNIGTSLETREPASLVKKFYTGINSCNLASVEDLIAENCIYEDLIFPNPFKGRKAILDFFQKFIDSVGRDLSFVIDDMSEEDSLAIGVTWHLEWKGKRFPFGKGCSFYRLEESNGRNQIVYGRDSVEPIFKPGESALTAIRGVTWLLEKFPQFANRL